MSAGASGRRPRRGSDGSVTSEAFAAPAELILAPPWVGRLDHRAREAADRRRSRTAAAFGHAPDHRWRGAAAYSVPGTEASLASCPGRSVDRRQTSCPVPPTRDPVRIRCVIIRVARMTGSLAPIVNLVPCDRRGERSWGRETAHRVGEEIARRSSWFSSSFGWFWPGRFTSGARRRGRASEAVRFPRGCRAGDLRVRGDLPWRKRLRSRVGLDRLPDGDRTLGSRPVEFVVIGSAASYPAWVDLRSRTGPAILAGSTRLSLVMPSSSRRSCG